MKGVILAGGVGSRLSPLTEITNKHLLPVGKEPMLWHPVRQLVGSGIDEILIVTSTHHMGSVVQSLGSGKRFGCEFTYRVQEEAQGIAHALAKAFSAGGRIVVLLGDNVFEYSIRPTRPTASTASYISLPRAMSTDPSWARSRSCVPISKAPMC